MEPLSLSSWPSPFIQRMFHHGDVMKIWYFIEDTGHVHGDCVHDCIASVIKRWHNCSFSFRFFLSSRYFFYFLCMEMSMIVMQFFLVLEILVVVYTKPQVEAQERFHWGNVSTDKPFHPTATSTSSTSWYTFVLWFTSDFSFHWNL